LGESRLFPLTDGSFVKVNRYNDKADRIDYIDYLKISDEDVTNEDCTGKIGNYFTATPMKLVPFDELKLIPLQMGQVHETKNEIQTVDINFLTRNGCITTGACQKLSIKSEPVCSFNKPVRFSVPYDAKCISNLKWSLSDSSALETASHVNDSTIEIKFTKEWQGKVYAYYEGVCGIEKDSLMVNLGSAGLIDLGADRSICEGDSVVLNAGNGFTNYLWNNNSADQKTAVFQKGMYTVEAVDPGGCISRDTFYITSVHPKPNSGLPESVQLCAGSEAVLNAGDGFAEYLWQNGSTSQTFEVNAAGKYSVKIKDGNGCIASDTVEVIDFASLPQRFLPADTSICVGSTITLQPKQSFAEYIWNTGVRTNSITVDQPGLYVLYASMDGRCWGKDSITISFANCTNDIRFPNAFSPNGDGKNDTYKVAAPVELVNYQLIIYNRWGQVLFKTTDPTAGWDGTISGKRQPSGTYIWQCRYQLKGNETKVKKGSLLLIRR
jgi:gliding motility-associated-like protein